MKWTYLLFAGFLAACNSGNHSDAEVAQLQSKIDELELELEQCVDGTLRVTMNESFSTYLDEYLTNPQFQAARTKFPVEYIHWENDVPGAAVVLDSVGIEGWPFQQLYMADFSYVPQIYDNWEGEMRPSDERLIHLKGIENGMDYKFFFQAIKGSWYLVKVENLGS